MWNVKENSDIRTTESSHIGHCAHISESSNVKVQNIYHGEYFQELHESFIQGLRFVTVVRWEANYVNMILSG
jgi:hypothetical protein